MLAGMGPDSERRFAELAVKRGLTRVEVVREVLARREHSVRQGVARKPLPQLLCELGVMERATAVNVLNEIRSRRPSTGKHDTLVVAPRGSSPLVQSVASISAPGRTGTIGPGMRL